jgi:hypothetical protein
MRLRLALASVALATLSSTALAAPPAVKGMWDGYGVGSWVSMKSSSKMEAGGMAMPAQENESRQTLVKVTDDEWTVKMETKTGGALGNAMEMKIPRKAPTGTAGTTEAPKPEDLGTENVSVEGKDYACKKQRITISGTATTTWTNEENGLLRMDSEGGTGTSSMVVTSLSKKAKAGDVEVTCRETKTTSKAPGMGETVMTSLTSDDVPMRMVRTEMSTNNPQMKMTSVTEVTGFEKK